MNTDLAHLTALELIRLYEAGAASPVETLDAVIRNYERLNPRYNAYRVFDADGALTAARTAEQRWVCGEPLGPVDGVPFAVKDMILTRGHATLYGSRAQSPDQDWLEDAPAVARLREAGAILLGKTTTSEFGWKGTADSPLTGITRNPHNPECTSGGSSGGAAVAAVVGIGPLQLGTDGGGSVRIPAAFCGAFGFKATFGRIPVWPPGPMLTLSHVGPISRSVNDARLMLNIITKPDDRDWYALPRSETDYLEDAVEGISGKRIGICLSAGSTVVDGEVETCIRNLAAVIEGLGAIVEEVTLPLDLAKEIFLTHWHAGARFLVERVDPDRRHLIDPGLRAAADKGAKLSLDTYYGSLSARQQLGATLQALFHSVDAVITPTVPIVAFKAGDEWPSSRDCDSWIDWNPFTYPFNLSRQPAASLPVGRSKDHLPIGAQIIGPLYSDAWVLQLARILEQLLPQPGLRPVNSGTPRTVIDTSPR